MTHEIFCRVSDDTYKKLQRESDRLGYAYVSGYLRSIVERHLGSPVSTPLSQANETDLPTFTKNEFSVLQILGRGPATCRMISDELRKQHSYIRAVVKGFENKLFVHIVEERPSRGRPADVFALTELGKIWLEVEQKKKNELREEAIKRAGEMSRDFLDARAPVKLLPNPTNNPITSWFNAAALAYTRKFPFYRDLKVLNAAVRSVERETEYRYILGETTYEDETLRLESEGWRWREDGWNEVAEQEGTWKPNVATTDADREAWEKREAERKAIADAYDAASFPTMT